MLLNRITLLMLLLGSLTLAACGGSSKESVTVTVTICSALPFHRMRWLLFGSRMYPKQMPQQR